MTKLGIGMLVGTAIGLGMAYMVGTKGKELLKSAKQAFVSDGTGKTA